MFEGHEVKPKGCSEPGCTASYVPHKWGSINAYKAGWFLQKNGKDWCPDHIPEWVDEWRLRTGRE
jgi:hypothetical protein